MITSYVFLVDVKKSGLLLELRVLVGIGRSGVTIGRILS